MDGLSSAASVIAVIQLTGSIVKICGGYVQDVKDAKDEIITLQQQVAGLKGVLERLGELLRGHSGENLLTCQTLAGDIVDCRSTLEALKEKIDPGTGKNKMRRLGFRALKWPLKHSEVEKAMRDIESASISAVSKAANLLDLKIDLSKLPVSEGAEFDSYEDQNEAACLPGTRTELLQRIAKWSVSPQGEYIFWLNGMAGTGKSTISRTVSASFKQDNLLGASFFFKRGEEDRKNAKKLVPTITRQVMNRLPQLQPGIQKAVSDEPNVAKKPLREQFEKLLLQPVLALEPFKEQIPTMVIVVDALDECEDDNEIRIILQLLPRLQESNALRFRIFLTSRPELPVNQGFSKIADHDYQDFVLHEIPEAVTEHDISLFLNYRLSQIKEQRCLPDHWPSYTDIQALVKISVPLFIFAATMCRVFEDGQWDPIDSLAEVLAHQSEEHQLCGTYLPVLNRLLAKQSAPRKKRLIQEFQEVVGSIVLLENPLSAISLSRLIGLTENQVKLRLDSLHSVLQIPKDPGMPVKLFHLSFRDFLLRERTEFWVDEQDMHQRLTIRCLRVCDGLRRNICELPGHGTLREEIDPQSIDCSLPPELQYSCRYWAQHLVHSKDLSPVLRDAFLFLQKHFLHWVEAMSILGLVSEVVGIIDQVQSVICNDIDFEMAEFLRDAKRFVLKNTQMADDSPLQLYCSGLLFAPRMSITRKLFEEEIPTWVRLLPEVEDTWSANLQTLEGHSRPVNTIAFSPNGRVLASGSSDGTIRLWNAATGALQQTSLRTIQDNTCRIWDTATGSLQRTFDSPNYVQSEAFSFNGQFLATGSSDRVFLWNTATSVLQQTLTGHTDSIYSVAFSPDDQLLASSSLDETIRIWATATGALLHTLQGHSDQVMSVAFAHNGQFLASGSYDGTIRLWDPAEGIFIRTLGYGLSSVCSIATSFDGQLIVSGTEDMKVRLWNVATGAQQTFEGHSSLVLSVAFSPDGRLVASGSYDETIKLWDVTTSARQQIQEREGRSERLPCIAFSPNGRLLASTSDNGTVRLWDAHTATLKQTCNGGFNLAKCITFSPDGQLLASGSNLVCIRIWDLSTETLWRTLKGHSESVHCVTFSPNGRFLASGALDMTVRLWDVTTGALEQTLDGHSGSVRHIVFSPNGQVLASSSVDMSIRLWTITTGALQQILTGYLDRVCCLKFSPNGQWLASGSYNATIRLWDTATGALQKTFSVSQPTDDLEFTEDGSYLCTNVGCFDILSGRDNHVPHSCRVNIGMISYDDQWIIRDGNRVLWLPPEYRNRCSAVKDGTLALGNRSGQMSFIKFCL